MNYNKTTETAVYECMDANELQVILDYRELRFISENVPLFSDMEVDLLRDFYLDNLEYYKQEKDKLWMDSMKLYLYWLGVVETRVYNPN